jgi:hypothetical protein
MLLVEECFEFLELGVSELGQNILVDTLLVLNF